MTAFTFSIPQKFTEILLRIPKKRHNVVSRSSMFKNLKSLKQHFLNSESTLIYILYMRRKLSNLITIFTFHFFLRSWSGPEDFSFSKFMTTLVIHSTDLIPLLRFGLKFSTVLQFIVSDYRHRVTVVEWSSFAFFFVFFISFLRLIINNRLLYVMSAHFELFFIVFEAFFPI